MISLALTNNLLAEGIYLNKDSKAPFNGVLLTDSQAKELRIKLIENSSNNQLIDSYKKSLQLLQDNQDRDAKRLSLCTDEVNNLSKANVDERNMSDWKKLGYVGVGILTTILTIYGVKQATK